LFSLFFSFGIALFAIALWKCKPNDSVEVAVKPKKIGAS